MTVLDDVLDSLDRDAPVRSVLVEAHWTLVCSRYGGLVATLMENHVHGHEAVRDVGRLHLKPARAWPSMPALRIRWKRSSAWRSLSSRPAGDGRLPALGCCWPSRWGPGFSPITCLAGCDTAKVLTQSRKAAETQRKTPEKSLKSASAAAEDL